MGKPNSISLSSSFAAQLRNELCARNAAFAAENKLDHVPSYGVPPVVVYAPHVSGLTHGNFFDRSYAAILKSPGVVPTFRKDPYTLPALPAAC